MTPESQKAIETKCNTMDQLCNMADNSLKSLLLAAPSSLPLVQRNEDYRRLSTALHKLRLYSAAASRGAVDTKCMELHWDSWNRASAALSAASMSLSYVSNASPSSSLECSAASSSTSSPRPDTSGNSYVYSSSAITSAGGSSMAPVPHGQQLQQPLPPPDSVASSMSSNSSIASLQPPPSPGSTLLPPVNWPDKEGTPPNTPPSRTVTTACFSGSRSGKDHQQGRFPTTPPPNRKHSTMVYSGAVAVAAVTVSQSPASCQGISSQMGSKTATTDFPLSKSRSHECDLGVRMNPQLPPPPSSAAAASASDRRINEEDETAADESATFSIGTFPSVDVSGSSRPAAMVAALNSRRRRQTASESSALPDDPHPSVGGASPSPLPSPSPFDSSSGMETSGSSSASLQVPRSPRTPRSMRHAIAHRFKKTLKPGRCDHCSEYMFNGELNIAST